MPLSDVNIELLRSLSRLLNDAPDFIAPDDVESLAADGLSAKDAVAIMVAAAIGLDLDNDEHFAFFNRYFPHIFKQLDKNDYTSNAYYKNILFPTLRHGRWQLKQSSYKPYELFVCDDFSNLNGMALPQIGFFDTTFAYPAVLEDGRIWMTVTPNEINTMRHAVDTATGKVLTFGLGLGYYAYMASLKNEGESITVADCDSEITKMFESYILPQFPHPEKVKIVNSDAFDYAKNTMPKMGFDLVFTDIWHDAGDGLELYRKMKSLECEGPKFEYWIEETLKWYL